MCTACYYSNVSELNNHRANHAFDIYKYFVHTKHDIFFDPSQRVCRFMHRLSIIVQRFSDKIYTHFSWLLLILKDLS